jgi:hypothetical protein
MVWKIGATDKSKVVMAKEFRQHGQGRSFRRITLAHPKG